MEHLPTSCHTLSLVFSGQPQGRMIELARSVEEKMLTATALRDSVLTQLFVSYFSVSTASYPYIIIVGASIAAHSLDS